MVAEITTLTNEGPHGLEGYSENFKWGSIEGGGGNSLRGNGGVEVGPLGGKNIGEEDLLGRRAILTDPREGGSWKNK